MKGLLNDPEIHAKAHELDDLVEQKAAEQGREYHTFAVIAYGPEGTSLILGGHSCPGCLRAIAATFEMIAGGDQSFMESPAHAH